MTAEGIPGSAGRLRIYKAFHNPRHPQVAGAGGASEAWNGARSRPPNVWSFVPTGTDEGSYRDGSSPRHRARQANEVIHICGQVCACLSRTPVLENT